MTPRIIMALAHRHIRAISSSMTENASTQETAIRPIDKRRRRFEETHEAAMSVIDEEAERRRAKTEKLKAMRLAQQR